MKNILVTRDRNKSQHIETAMAIEGCKLLFEPLFEVQKLPLKVSKYKAAIITSSNAADSLIDADFDPKTIIYSVGKSSAQNLIKAGFENVIYASQPNAKSLKSLIIEQHNKSEAIFYPHGTNITLDFAEELGALGFNIEKVQSYEVHENLKFSSELLNFAKQDIFDEVLIFSKNSGKIFYELCLKHNLLEYFMDAQLLCLSEEIADEMKRFGFKNSVSFEKIPSLKKIYD